MLFLFPCHAGASIKRFVQRWITRQFGMRARLINGVSRLLLLGVGIFDLSINGSLSQTYFQ
jgi:hypothetical protein